MVDIETGLAAIGRLGSMFDAEHIEYWIFGGWAVDLHVGHVTREHDDIDVAVWLSDFAAIRTLLAVEGWAHIPFSADDGYTTYSREGVDVDLAFLARDEGGVYTPSAAGRGEWPPDSFGADVRELAGHRAHVVSLSSLLADKSQVREGADTAAKDAADVSALRSNRSASST
jgi:hypothetical protein